MAQRASIEKYGDGSVTLTNMRNNLGVPVFGLNETISATMVDQYWDGSPMDDSKVDGKLYLKLKKLPAGADSSMQQYVGKYFRTNLPNWGELFLEKDTMAEMRDLSLIEILLLKAGYYKGVRLNGYYVKNDTPGPIDYILSSSSDADDGGSVITVGDIKLEHLFVGSINGVYYGLLGDGSNETSKFQRIILNITGKSVLIPKAKTYYVCNQLNIINKGTFILDFNDNPIDYQSLDGNRLIYLENVSNAIIGKFKTKGKMFDGLDVNTVSALPLDASKTNRKNTHRVVVGTQCSNINLISIEGSEYYGIIDFRNSTNIHVDNIKGENINTGLIWTNVTGSINKCVFKDCRFNFFEEYADYQLGYTSAQGSGITLEIPEGGSIEVNDCNLERCWTNGFRVQGTGGNVVFRNCHSYQNARHGFSVYGPLNSYKIYNCSDTNLGDTDFWNGTPTDNTYKIPAREVYPTPISIQHPMPKVYIEDFTINNKLYSSETAPINNTLTPSGVRLASIPYQMINLTVWSGETGRYGDVSLKNIKIKGFTNPKADSIVIDNINGSLDIDNFVFENKVGTDSNYPQTDKYNLSITADNIKLNNITTIGGFNGTNVLRKTVNSKYCVLNTVLNNKNLGTGLRTVSATGYVPIVSNCAVVDADTFYYQPYDCLFINNQAVNTRATAIGTVLNILTVDLVKDNTANTINNVRYTGLFTNILSTTSQITGRNQLISRPKVTGNNSALADDDLITFKNFTDTVASTSRNGTVKRSAFHADATATTLEDLVIWLNDFMVKYRASGQGANS